MMQAVDNILGFAPDGELEKPGLAECPYLLHEWRMWVSLMFFRIDPLQEVLLGDGNEFTVFIPDGNKL
jgi:hypothetical protein